MKKIIYSITTAICVLAGFSACTDILDTTPHSSVSSGNMWLTENLTDMGVAAVYSNLRGLGLQAGANGFGYFAFDQWGYMGQTRDAAETFLAGSVTPGDGTFSNTWKRYYEGVHRANDAIKNIPLKSPVSDVKKARLIAECKFLRAWSYYHLNELFKGVPIYLEPITVEQCTKGQSTEDEVWAQVIADLTDCINEPNLPNIDQATGRVTKGAAYALRGKTYMQQKKYDLAAADFAKVGDCGYKLFSGNYKDLFTEVNERCPEMIFSIQNITDVGFGGNSQFYCGTRSSFGSCWNTFVVSPAGVDLFENTDGTPFSWDKVIPGYTAMAPKDREVFFLRDTVDATGKRIDASVTTEVAKRLVNLSASAKAMYLPSGNEARIKKAYENRDPRLAASVITPYSNYTGVLGADAQVTTSRWPMVSQSLADLWTDSRTAFYYLERKFVYEGNNPIPARDRCPIDEPLIRYADVLLMWAEALVEQNKLSDAADKVNMVRARAKMPNVTYASQSELREKVRNERRVEFVNEGINFFDEMRWKTWKDTKFKAGNGVAHVWGFVQSPYVWPGDQLYTWPVPTSETQMVPNLKQTPGWVY